MPQPQRQPEPRRAGARLRAGGAMALLGLVLAALSWRLYQHRPAPGPADERQWALLSYRDVIYYPLRAVRDGVNPYDCVRDGDPRRYLHRYPVADQFPLYSPLVLALFAPPALLSVEASLAAFAALNVACFVAFAAVALRLTGWTVSVASVSLLAAALLASQAGRGAFNSGQIALTLALATAGALHWGDRRPWAAAACLVVATIKPTFGLPLAALLAARGDWRSAVLGLAAGGAAAAMGLAVIFARSGDLSVERAAAVLRGNQEYFAANPSVVAATNRARLDLPAAVEYLTGRSWPEAALLTAAALVLGLTAAALWPGRGSAGEPDAASAASALLIVATYVSLYHNVYDGPLLALPALACLSGTHPAWSAVGRRGRWLVAGLLLIPVFNPLWTEGCARLVQWGASWAGTELAASQIARVNSLGAALNGCALVAAWVWLLAAVALDRHGAGAPVGRAEETVDRLGNGGWRSGIWQLWFSQQMTS